MTGEYFGILRENISLLGFFPSSCNLIHQFLWRSSLDSIKVEKVHIYLFFITDKKNKRSNTVSLILKKKKS